MKILIINTVPTEKNGITNVIFNYVKAINDDNFVFDLLAINDLDDIYKQTIKQHGGDVYILHRHNVIAYLLKLSRLIRRNKYDAIHIHGNSHTLCLELLAAKIGGCKSRIVHAHSTSCLNIKAHYILQKPFDSLCTARIACGKDAGLFMYGNNNFDVINNGVDTEKYAFDAQKRKKVRDDYGIREDDILLGHVGYFLPLKNQRFIVEVLKQLLEINDNYKLLLIGDGELRPSVEQQVKDYGLDSHVFFAGNIDNVFDYLNAIDIVIMPSIFEGVPLTLIEQQANGIRCFVSDTITHEADKTGNLTFISLQENADAWAKTILSTKDNMSRSERSKMAIECIKNAGYDIISQAKVLEVFYKNVLKNRN